MGDRLQILMNEYSEVRASERATRSLLYQINAFTATIVSGLLIAISVYRIQPLALTAPLILCLVGFLWSPEALRLFRITAHVRLIERAGRRILGETGKDLPKGFEDQAHPATGIFFLLRHNNVFAATALMYAVFFLVFLLLLSISSYDMI